MSFGRYYKFTPKLCRLIKGKLSTSKCYISNLPQKDRNRQTVETHCNFTVQKYVISVPIIITILEVDDI